MDIARELLSCACQSAWQQICQQVNYIRQHEENDRIMRRELDLLRSQENEISVKLNSSNVRHGKRPREEITNWLKNVEEIESDVNNLGSGDAQFWLNYYLRLKRSKKTVQILDRVKDLQARGNLIAQSEDIFMDSLAESLSNLPISPLHGNSAEWKKNEILQCIMDPEVSKIGVYGMGGIGKTTIMTQIYNELNQKKVFEIIIWVTVSSSFNEKEIQNKVAERLQCQLSSSADLTSRAHVLHEAFRRRRNFVIILDDIWKSVSLHNVGIPEPNRSNGSKVVWTTRFMDICNSMESEREIKVKGLTDEEAWNLFKDKVGAEDVIMSTEIQPIAKQVARECGRLPLALITVGCALRKANQPQVWRNALQQLKTSKVDQICGVGEKVFKCIKFSYDSLSSNTTRECFLYCALYPEDCNIFVDKLIEHWMGEGLINEKGSIQTDKDKGYAYIKELEDACMIESTEFCHIRCVKMHDLVRDLAINITSQEPRFMVKARFGLTESPEEEEWVQSLQRVSLMSNNIKAFGGQPNCPRLSTLLLQNGPNSSNPSETTFSNTFFKHMHNLRVLNLSYTGIKSLPDSISNLVNLQALILQGCLHLECLPSLARLQKLRQLDLSKLFALKVLPDGLENLVKLRHLNISNQRRGDFPSGALLKMPCLEILYMDNSMTRFGRRLGNFPNGHACDSSTVEEIISLKILITFTADFADVLALNSYINGVHEFDRLKNFDHFMFRVSHKYVGHNVRK